MWLKAKCVCVCGSRLSWKWCECLASVSCNMHKGIQWLMDRGRHGKWLTEWGAIYVTLHRMSPPLTSIDCALVASISSPRSAHGMTACLRLSSNWTHFNVIFPLLAWDIDLLWQDMMRMNWWRKCTLSVSHSLSLSLWFGNLLSHREQDEKVNTNLMMHVCVRYEGRRQLA